MKVTENEIVRLRVSESGKLIGLLSLQIEDGEVLQNISVDVRVAGNREQTISDAEAALRLKAKEILLVAAGSL